MRTVYLGTADFAATVLHRLTGSPHAPVLVVTPPDRRQGRGRRAAPSPAAVAAAELGVEVLRAANVNEAEPLGRIRGAAPEAIVVCAFGQLIREPLLSLTEILNVHPSLLPRWRGAAPIERAIMARDRVTGVCVMRLTAGLDAGPVALRAALPLGGDEDYGALAPRLAARGGDLLVEALDRLAAGSLAFTAQDETGATYAEKIDPAERRLDPARPAVELAAVVRALTPHIGAYLELAGGERLGVRKASAGASSSAATSPAAVEVAPDGDALLIGTGDGVLRLEVVQPPGGKPMAAADYLRGHALPKLA